MRASLFLLPVLVLLAAAAGTTGGCHSAGVYPYSSSGGSAPLVGGVTDDNVRLPEYLAYVDAYPHDDVPKLDLTDRQVFTVVGRQGLPLWDVPVKVDLPSGPFLARTNAAGRVLLPRAALGIGPQPVPVRVWSQGDSQTRWLSPSGDAVRADLPRRWTREGVGLDVALVVDTTSSMSDEVARLRTTLKSVVSNLGAHPTRPFVRVGGVAYRDVGDRYVTWPFDFTADLDAVQRRLDRMDTGGGGDGPEAVQEALGDAVERLSWGGEGTVRVLFLIGDAPPHFEHGTPYTVTMRRAVEKGITIFPVACSGMDDTGEFVWRQLAAVTLGQFLFVSYGGGTEHHTGPYLENDLDVLMTRAVTAQLDALTLDGSGVQNVAPPSPVSPPPERRWCPPPPSQPLPLPSPYATPTATSRGDRTGIGRAPWDFGVPGWQR